MTKKVLITGGGTGIGKAIAKTFYEKGYEVYICLLYTSPSPRD